MIRSTLASACALAALLAGGLQAQDAPCPGGRDDTQGFSMTMRVAGGPARAAQRVDAVLAEAGYTVRSTPSGEGGWSIAPRHTFVEGLNEGMMQGVEHPGVQLMVRARSRGDSTEIAVGAHTLCRTLRNGTEDEEAESAIELVHALVVLGALEERMEGADAGAEPGAPAEDGPDYAIEAPDQVAGFRRASRHDYDDPAAGINMRYARDDGSYIDLYVYPGTPPECDAACGARYVNEEADGFVADFPEYIRRGYYGRMKVTADETLPVPAGAPWLFGRHLTLDVEMNGRDQESHYYLFAFPGYKVKIRATFPLSARMVDDVRAFVDELLPQMVSRT